MDIQTVAARCQQILAWAGCLLSAVLVAASGPAVVRIDQVVAALAARDQIIGNFCSTVSVAPTSGDGQTVGPATWGVRCYAKPDISILCLQSTNNVRTMQGEVGTRLHAEGPDRVTDATIADSFFLRDLRSLVAVHRGAAAFQREAPAARPRFTFEDHATTSPRAADGRYTLIIEAPGYERATLRVDATSGVVLEKTVRSSSTGAEIAHEAHSDFVMVGGGALPGLTVYRYGGRTVTVRLRDYRVNLRLDLQSFASGQRTCDALTDALHGVNPAAPATTRSQKGEQ